MKLKMHFEVVIKASAQKVWDTMLTQETYKEWTSVFEPTSCYEGSWDKGSKIKFLSSDGGGMVSEIVESIPHKFVSIKHLGEIKNGVEDTTSEQVKKWTPVFENYTFTDKGVETYLAIDMEMPSTPEAKAMKEMFEVMWPKALLKLKEVCER
jgi:uncharacterized protein YndB with AHSA1/START domain